MNIGKTPKELGLDKGTILGPELGWKNQTYYTAEVSYGPHNPVHKAIVFCGFGITGGYSVIWSFCGEKKISEAYYIKALDVIYSE